MKIYIFSLNGCAHCAEIKKSLTDLSIPFNDIEITLNREIWRKIVEQTKEDIVPTVFIQNNENGDGLAYLPGRDFKNNEEIIEIIKNQYFEKGDK